MRILISILIKKKIEKKKNPEIQKPQPHDFIDQIHCSYEKILLLLL